jgi:hypothetical protein
MRPCFRYQFVDKNGFRVVKNPRGPAKIKRMQKRQKALIERKLAEMRELWDKETLREMYGS